MAELPHVWGYETIGTWTRIRMSTFALLDAAVLTLGSMGAGKGVATLVVGGGIASVLLHRSPGVRRLAPYWIGLVALLLAHGAVRLVFREWYAFPFSLAYAILLGHAINSLRRRLDRPWVSALFVAVVLAAGIDLETHDRLRGGYFGTLTLDPHVVASTERSGDTDGGVYCYLAGDNRTNLDGIVNWDALNALRSGTMLDYIEQAHIRHFSVAELTLSPPAPMWGRKATNGSSSNPMVCVWRPQRKRLGGSRQ